MFSEITNKGEFNQEMYEFVFISAVITLKMFLKNEHFIN